MTDIINLDFEFQKTLDLLNQHYINSDNCQYLIAKLIDRIEIHDSNYWLCNINNYYKSLITLCVEQ